MRAMGLERPGDALRMIDLPRPEARGISVVIGGPFNSGILARGPGEGVLYDYLPAGPEVIERVRRLDDVCSAHGVPLAAAALQFSLGHPAVVSVIPGMRDADEVSSAIALMNHPIPDDCWRELRHQGLIGETVVLPSATSGVKSKNSM